jgi:nucleotide-binding universal stress UspA family protein
MIKKVLIATDGSEHAQKAVAFGSDIAAKFDAEVLLVHVLLHKEASEELLHFAQVEYGIDVHRLSKEAFAETAAAPATTYPAAEFPAFTQSTKQDSATPSRVLNMLGEVILKRGAETAREHGVRIVNKQIVDGNPANRILELVEAESIDLVVSGARGLSDLKALAVGSVSHNLIQLSPVPCVTVR